MITKIKNIIKNNFGKQVEIMYNEGRNKIFVYRGRIIEVYNNVFIIMDDENSCKRCFSYYDILTNMVRIHFR